MLDVTDNRARWLELQVLPHERGLRAWLSQRAVPGLDVDDVVQETYAKLASLASVRDIREPRRYLFQTAFSVVAQHLRRSKVISIATMANLDGLSVASSAVSEEQRIIQQEELQELADALSHLPAKCREVLLLRRVSGLSQREAAVRLGLSEKSIEKYMSQSVQFLMDRFGKGGKGRAQASRNHGAPKETDYEIVSPRS